jgi:hypothetical protein
VPLNVTTEGEFVASLKKETCPAELPVVLGVKATVTEALVPAFTVTGKALLFLLQIGTPQTRAPFCFSGWFLPFRP